MNTRLYFSPLFVFAFSFVFTGHAMAIEEPEYRVIEQSEEFELRAYKPKIIAETLVSGSMDEASSKGFKLIASYIFGNNTSTKGSSEKISMTAPVAMAAESEKIKMTAPVTMEKSGDQWRIYFVMPREYTMATLPKPNNPAVTLRVLPAGNYAAIRFSGLVNSKKVANKTQELKRWLKEKGITSTGTLELARYNPPWTLPFLRRNEIIIAY